MIVSDIIIAAIVGTSIAAQSGDDLCTASAGKAIEQALNLASAQAYDRALECLGEMPSTASDDPQTVFAKARILAWAGQHEQASAVYRELLEEFPDNADFQFGYAQLIFYQGNTPEAAKRFRAIVARYPDYRDVQIALDRALVEPKTQTVRPAKQHRWRLDSGANVSTFERSANENWYAAFSRTSYQADGFSVFGAASHLRRFGFVDNTVTVGASRRLKNDRDISASIHATPDADFRPDIGGNIEVGKLFTLDKKLRLLVKPTIDYRIDSFDGQNIHTFRPGIIAYLPKGIRVEGRVISIAQNGVDT